MPASTPLFSSALRSSTLRLTLARSTITPSLGLRTNSTSTSSKNRIYPNRIRNSDELHTLILLSASSRIPLLTFWSTTWCSTCKTLLPQIQSLLADDGVGEAEGGVSFVEVELDAPDLSGVALRYGVNNIPTLLAFDRGEAQLETKVAKLQDLKSREFLSEWVRKEAARRGEGGAGGSLTGWLGGIFGGGQGR